MRVLVTGATGFLGHHVAARLARRGAAVRVLVRASSDTRALDSLPVERVTGNLEDAASLRAAVTGADGVIHCAGGGRARSRAELDSSNVAATRHLIAAARAHGRPALRFVFVSSLAAQGPSRDARPLAAEGTPAPISDYGRAKLAAEREVLAARGDLHVTVLRPPVIYGPRDTRLAGLFRAAQHGVLPVVRGVRALSTVYGPDCAAALVAMLEAPTPSGRIYYVEDGTAHEPGDLARHVARAVGRPGALLLPVPPALLWLGGALSELWYRGRGRPTAFTRDKVVEASQPWWICDAAAARDELGWRPTVDFAEGARATATWYRDNGWL